MNDKQPKLYIANDKGQYVAEYMPPANYKFVDWFRYKYLNARVHFGKEIYYWHVRHNLLPHIRKVSDIEFIHHVMKDHDQNPTDPVEKRHYKRAWALYGHETNFVTAELAKDEITGWKDGEFTNGHGYAYGYKMRWYEKFPQVETRHCCITAFRLVSTLT